MLLFLQAFPEMIERKLKNNTVSDVSIEIKRKNIMAQILADVFSLLPIIMCKLHFIRGSNIYIFSVTFTQNNLHQLSTELSTIL